MDVPVKKGTESGKLSKWSGETACEPLTDIVETGQQVILKADLPGVSKDDLKVTLDKGLLTIEGRSKVDLPDKADLLFQEIEFGRFYRGFRLGSDVSSGKLDASFEDGVLKVVLPKSDWAAVKKIEVK